MHNLSFAYKELNQLKTQLSEEQMRNLLKKFSILDLDPRYQNYKHLLKHPELYLDLGPDLNRALSEVPTGNTIH